MKCSSLQSYTNNEATRRPPAMPGSVKLLLIRRVRREVMCAEYSQLPNLPPLPVLGRIDTESQRSTPRNRNSPRVAAKHLSTPRSMPPVAMSPGFFPGETEVDDWGTLDTPGESMPVSNK